MSISVRVAMTALVMWAGSFAPAMASATPHVPANVPLHAAVDPAALATTDTVPAPDAVLQPAVAVAPDEATLAGGSMAPAIVFGSLAAAVAAQPMVEGDDAELHCLAGAVYFESHGEPLLGQLAVAKVILNRTRSGRYPTTACGVVTQRSQFSFVHGGVMPPAPANAAYRTALAIARIARTDAWSDPSEGALSFHARRVAPGWAMRRVTAIGNHIFYK